MCSAIWQQDKLRKETTNLTHKNPFHLVSAIEENITRELREKFPSRMCICHSMAEHLSQCALYAE